jgi:hypothetical protein
MLTFQQGADPNSLPLYRGKRHIGYLQWHRGTPPRIVLVDSMEYLALSEIDQILKRFDYERGGRQNEK